MPKTCSVKNQFACPPACQDCFFNSFSFLFKSCISSFSFQLGGSKRRKFGSTEPGAAAACFSPISGSSSLAILMINGYMIICPSVCLFLSACPRDPVLVKVASLKSLKKKILSSKQTNRNWRSTCGKEEEEEEYCIIMTK